MLSIPAKRTEVTDFTKPMQKFFAKRFSPADQAHFQNDITSFQQLRSSAVAVTDALDQLGQQHLMRYNYHLASITMRLGSYEREMNLTFSWYDAYRPSRRFSSPSFYYDWIGVIWNMAAFESVRAARADRSTEEGIRIASKGFQQAAGLFGYIMEHLCPKITAGLSPDVTPEGLQMAREIMLAQAQVCFYEKAVRDRKSGGMKATIICKLASQASKFFQSALSFARLGAMPGTLDVSYTATLQFQAECFNGAAQYWASVMAKENALQKGSGYGEEIARLTKAEQCLSKALEIGQKNSLSGPLVIAATELISAIRRAKTAAINDNNTIYLEAVPNPDSFPELDGVKMVKPLDFPEYYNNEKPLFKDMTPPEVRSAFESFQMKLDALVKAQADESEAASNSARSALVAQGLPGSLEMYKAGGQLPENLWAKIERVQSLGAFPELRNKFRSLMDSSARAERGLDNIVSTALREQQQDDAFRSRYASCTEASIPLSTNLFREIRENVDQLRSALAVAKESDRTIAADLDSKAILDDASILTLPKSEVSRLISNSLGPNFVPDLLETPGTTVDTTELERSLVELAALIERRAEYVRAWQAEVQSLGSHAEPIIEQLINRLAAAPSENLENAVKALLDTNNPKISALGDFKNHQDALIAKILHLNEVFNQQRARDASIIAREKTIKTIEQSIAKFYELHSKLSSGTTFYTGLQLRISRLQQTCEDLGFSQEMQRNEFEQSMVREHERHMQEEKDREYASKLASEFQAMSVQPSQPTVVPPAAPMMTMSAPMSSAAPNPLAAYPGTQAPAQHSQPAVGSSGIVYGTPMAQPSTQYGSSGYPPQYPAAGAAPSYGAYSGTNVPGTAGSALGRPGAPHGAYSTMAFQPPAAAAQPPVPQQQQPQAPQSYYAQQYAAGAQQPPPLPPKPQHAAPQPAPMPYSYGGVPYSAAPQAPASAPAPYPGSAAPQQAQPQTPGSMDNKAMRLAEMGFPYPDALRAIHMYGGNEEAALNYLLGGGGAAAPPPAAAPAPSTQSSMWRL